MKIQEEYFKPATTAEIIEKLQALPQHIPCYIRPKYYGVIYPEHDVPINLNGIALMEKGNKQHITFLL